MLQISMKNYNTRYKKYTDQISREFIVLFIMRRWHFVKIYQISVFREEIY